MMYCLCAVAYTQQNASPMIDQANIQAHILTTPAHPNVGYVCCPCFMLYIQLVVLTEA